jgi:vancomycin permeability regulator SanA
VYGLAAVVVVIVGAAALVTSSVDGAVRGRIYGNPANAPSSPLALVLGAEVYANGYPSPALVNRLDTSIQLYRSGKVRALLMSGGHGTVETSAMRRYALAAGVPEVAIRLDDGGLRTLSSCQRARDVFHASRVTVISQAEHLTRAVYICDKLGLDAIGVVAPDFPGPALWTYRLRERAAVLLAWWEVNAPGSAQAAESQASRK